MLKYAFIVERDKIIHNTLTLVDRNLRLMGDKTISNKEEPRLESFDPPFVAGIYLPPQGVVNSYNLLMGIPVLTIRHFHMEMVSRLDNFNFNFNL